MVVRNEMLGKSRLESLSDCIFAFAMTLLEDKHVLVVPGSSFNVDYTDHFRITLLPDEEMIRTVFQRIESLLDEMQWPLSQQGA